MRYIVETRCYWNGRLYNRGEVVEFDPSIDVPEHFKAAEPVEEVTPEPVEEVTPEPVEEVTPEPVEESTPEPVDEGGSEEAPKKPTRRKKG